MGGATIPGMEWIVVTLASLLAGFVDAVVGGGGLILVPALFSAFPSAAPATLLGTNKSASVWGTLFSARQYSRRVQFRWGAIAPAIVASFSCSLLGAWAVTQVSADFLRKLLPLILVALLVYTLAKKQLGQHHAPRFEGRQEAWVAVLIGIGIGFYDGFFGPGTGSFLIFLFIRFFGFDFLHASAASKVVNVATNLAAIGYFVPNGYFLPAAGVLMASANIGGSFVGAHLALRHGSGFVRRVFLAVVSVLIVKFAWDTF